MRKLKKFVQKTPFITDVATLQSGTFVVIGLQGLFTIIAARILGKQDLGLYTIALTIVGTIGLFTNIGQNKGLITLLSEAYGAQSKQKVLDALAYYAQATLFWTLPILTLASIITVSVLHSTYEASHMWLWVLLGAVTLYLLPFFDLLIITIQSKRKIPHLAAIESGIAAMELIVPLAFLLVRPTVTSLMAGKVVASATRAAACGVLWRMILKDDPLLPDAKTLLKKSTRRISWKDHVLGLWISAESQISKFAMQIPIYLLANFGSASLVGTYKIFFSYIDLSTKLSSSVGRLLGSVLPQIYMKDRPAFSRSFWRGNIATMLIMYSVLIPLLVIGNRGLTTLFGTEYAVPDIMYAIAIPWGLNGLTVGFAAYYRIHRALHLQIWMQVIAALSGILVWFLLSDGNLLIATAAQIVTASTVAKLCHFVNFQIIKRKTSEE